MPDDRPTVLKVRPDHFIKLREKVHILYRCYTARALLLYVGMTNNPEQRFRHHRADKPWWKYVDHITLQKYPNRTALAKAEATAIDTEKPKFNLALPGGTAIGPIGNLWPHASNFGTVIPDHGFLIEQTLEQQLYPCVECHARAIYCEGETVACELCSSSWPYEDWFDMTFNQVKKTRGKDNNRCQLDLFQLG